MDDCDEDLVVLVSPEVDPEDIKQEVELLKLQGIKPNKSLIYRRVKHYEAYCYGLDITSRAFSPIEWADYNPVPDPQVLAQLTEWALEQSELIRYHILSFLEDPCEESLEEVMVILRDAGIVEDQPKREKGRGKTTSSSLTSVILRALASRKMSEEELVNLARHTHPSKRPEAAVRTITRRLMKTNKIIQTRKGTTYVYSLS